MRLAALTVITLLGCRDWDGALANRQDAGFGSTGGGTAASGGGAATGGGGTATGGGSATGGGGAATGGGGAATGGGGGGMPDAGTLVETWRYESANVWVRLVARGTSLLAVGDDEQLQPSGIQLGTLSGGNFMSFTSPSLCCDPSYGRGVSGSTSELWLTTEQDLYYITSGNTVQAQSCGWPTNIWTGQSQATPDEVWFTGDSTRSCVWRRGASFVKVDVATLSGHGTLEDSISVKAFADGTRYFVGVNGQLIRWADGGTPELSPYPFISQPQLNFVSGFSSDDVWAVGENGSVVRWNDGGWALEPSTGAETLHEISFGTADDIWTVGDTKLYHWNGSGWDTVPVPNPTAGDVYHLVYADGLNTLYLGGYTNLSDGGTQGFVRRFTR